MPPIDLLVQDRNSKEILESLSRKELKEVTVECWQARWTQNLEVWPLTKMLIPSNSKRLSRKHREADYLVTQVLTRRVWGLSI